MCSVYGSSPVRASPFVIRSALPTYPATQRSGKVPGFENHRLFSDFPRAGSFNFRFLAVFEDGFISDAKENVACLEVTGESEGGA